MRMDFEEALVQSTHPLSSQLWTKEPREGGCEGVPRGSLQPQFVHNGVRFAA